MLTHLVDTGHTVDINKAFRPIYRVSPFHTKAHKHKQLAIAEAISIRLLNPILCIQKQFVQSLRLPWPGHSIGSTLTGLPLENILNSSYTHTSNMSDDKLTVRSPPFSTRGDINRHRCAERK